MSREISVRGRMINGDYEEIISSISEQVIAAKMDGVTIHQRSFVPGVTQHAKFDWIIILKVTVPAIALAKLIFEVVTKAIKRKGQSKEKHIVVSLEIEIEQRVTKQITVWSDENDMKRFCNEFEDAVTKARVTQVIEKNSGH